MKRQQEASEALLTEHVGHWLRAVSPRRLRCHSCQVTIGTPLAVVLTGGKTSSRSPSPKLACPAWCASCSTDEADGAVFHRSIEHPLVAGASAATAYATVFTDPQTGAFEELEIHTACWDALTAAQAREAGAALIALTAQIELGVQGG